MKKQQLRCVAVENRISGSGRRYELALSDPTGCALQQLIVCLQLPGIEQCKLDAALDGNVLTIKVVEKKSPEFATLQRSEIIGDSGALHDCLEKVALTASDEEPVLILGETGTGKELFARAVHRNSRRDGENFVVVDCRSIPESIAEKLLLGQARKGRRGQSGLLSQARRGTLFLDEIGDLSLSTQSLFRKLLYERCYRPVGASVDTCVDFRLVVATNRNLRQLVAQGKFNSELLSLLQSRVIEIPPLRNRLDDIAHLTEFFLQHYCRYWQLGTKDISTGFMDMLKKYPWPGNVRELKNSLGQALLVAKNQKTLFPKDLPAHIRVQVKKSAINQNKDVAKELQRDSLRVGLFGADTSL